MKNSQPKAVKTNKGEFPVRYIYRKYNPMVGEINVIVVNTNPAFDGPFTGDYGDEIPMMDTYREQFKVEMIWAK